MVKKATAVMIVNEVEPCSKFWVERLGFQETASVPDGDKVAFCMLQSGTTELMYQSLASAEKDTGAATGGKSAPWLHTKPVCMYVEVENLDRTMAALEGAPVAMPVRTTFYGAKEFGVYDPGGHFIIFAQMGAS